MIPCLFDDENLIQKMSPHLSVTTVNGICTVFWNYHFAVVSFREGDDFSKRAAAVFLAQTKLAKLAEIADLMGWAQITLKVILKNYRKQGVVGLLKKKTGVKSPKITMEIYGTITGASGLTHNEITNLIQKKYGVVLHRTAITLVKSGKIHKDQLPLFEESDAFLASLQVKLPNDAKPLKSVGQRKSSASKEEKSLTAETPIEEPPAVEVPAGKLQVAEMMGELQTGMLAEEPQAVEAPAVELRGVEAVADMPAANPLPQPVAAVGIPTASRFTRYAGGFLLLPFLQQIDPVGLFQKAEALFEKNNEEAAHAYGVSGWMMTLLFLQWFGFSTIESFKFACRREFSVLLGSGRAPAVKTLREYSRDHADPKVTNEWMQQLARRYMALDIIQLGTLYFDGHKIPYYGHLDLPKGYTSTRRFPMKGIQQTFANDRRGRPVFLRVHDTSQSFKETVLEMIRDALELWKETKVRSPLIVAFDRELYDTDFFTTLDEWGVLYITWRKWDVPLSFAELTESVLFPPLPLINGQPQHGPAQVRYHSLRREITVKGYAIEAISFVDGEAEDKAQITPSTLVTNARRFTKERYPDFAGLPAGEIIDTLCYRWRQENYFRHSKHQQHLDYIPSYESKERTVERTVANPLLKQNAKEMAELRKKVGKLNDQIAKSLTDPKNREKSLETILQQKNIQPLTQQKEAAEARLQELKKEKATIEERVSATEKGEEQIELVLDRKIFLDVLRIVMHNANQMLLDVFKRCYNDPRDLHDVLKNITRQSGTVHETKTKVIVTLNSLEAPTYKRATEQLCKELNDREFIWNERGKKLVFRSK